MFYRINGAQLSIINILHTVLDIGPILSAEEE